MAGYDSMRHLPLEAAAVFSSGKLRSCTPPLVNPWLPVTLNTGIDLPGTPQNVGPKTVLWSTPTCCRSPSSVCPPPGYAVSPVMTANRAPLCDICLSTFVWSALTPPAYACPQSPKTAKLYGAVDPAFTCEVNFGLGSVPSRSVLPSLTR